MDSRLQSILELNHEPMFAVENGRFSGMNAAAERFPKVRIGDSGWTLIPDCILFEPSQSFVSNVVLSGVSFTVSALRDGETLLLSLYESERPDESSTYLSDSLMNDMLSALMNIKLSSDRLGTFLDSANPNVKEYLSIQTHSFYLLNHKLTNLNLIRALNEPCASLLWGKFDLVLLCRNLAQSIDMLQGGKLAEIKFSSEAETLFVDLDSSKIERLVCNLLSNAMKNTPKGKAIRLRVFKSGNNAVISVDDEGNGIAPDKLMTVFNAYENRLNPASLSSPGNGGLGLGICRRIAELHGGTMILESREGIGTSVRVLLPLEQKREVLRSDSAAYAHQGMSLILTEFSDILDRCAYEPKYLD